MAMVSHVGCIDSKRSIDIILLYSYSVWTIIFVILTQLSLIVFHSLVFSIRFFRKYASHAVTYLEFFETDILEAKRQTIDLEIITEDELVEVYQWFIVIAVLSQIIVTFCKI